MIIKKDFLGLYVVAGKYISRPFFGTIFKEGDVVKSYHFNGSTLAGVTFPKENFTKSSGVYEYWTTTVDTQQYEKISFLDIQTKTESNKSYFKGVSFIYEEKNKEFKNTYENPFK